MQKAGFEGLGAMPALLGLSFLPCFAHTGYGHARCALEASGQLAPVAPGSIATTYR